LNGGVTPVAGLPLFFVCQVLTTSCGAMLADELGRVDSVSKAAEAEMKALKDEFKARGLSAATGDAFVVTLAA
jgi:hypothetical protein